MRTIARRRVSHPVCRKVCALTLLGACSLLCQGLSAQGSSDATKLRATYEMLTPQLDHNAFHRRLYLVSQESPSTVKGEIYAVMHYPFATVNQALNDRSRGPTNCAIC